MELMIEKLAALAGAFFVLSLTVEKISDLLKLRNPDLRTKRVNDPDAEKMREKRILGKNMLVGILLALALKADAFQMLVSGEPGEVIGWENVFFYDESNALDLTLSNAQYFESLSFTTKGVKPFVFWLFTLAGIGTTGVALSFGSKFWHDILGIIYQVKKARENLLAAGESKPRKAGGLK